MKKIIILITILSVLIGCMALSVGAEEAVIEVTGENIVTTVPTDIESPDDDIDGDTEDEALISEVAKAFVEEYLAEIASIATIILTSVLIFLQKKGLLPVISRGFSALVEILNNFKKNTEDKVSSLGEDMKPVIERMNKAIEECERMEKSFSDLKKLFELEQEEKKLLEKKIEESNARDMLTCEMLCQILMCTNVPQYMKDKIAEYFESAKKTIADSAEGKAVTSDEAIS